MEVTTNFFQWFLLGGTEPGHIGGWIFFMLLAAAAIVWIIYNSATRKLPALGWRMSVILTALLIVPTMIYRFTIDPLDPSNILASPLARYHEVIFYLGVLGGLLPVILSVGYFVTYQGMVGCPRGIHTPYEKVLGQCPGCAEDDMKNRPQVVVKEPVRERRQEPVVERPPEPHEHRKVQAWLAASNGKSYQLCEGETTIGRQASNDIYLTGDNTVGRQHAKIVQQGRHFKLYHLSTTSITRVNGHTVREPALLESGDEIIFGDNTKLQFKN